MLVCLLIVGTVVVVVVELKNIYNHNCHVKVVLAIEVTGPKSHTAKVFLCPSRSLGLMKAGGIFCVTFVVTVAALGAVGIGEEETANAVGMCACACPCTCACAYCVLDCVFACAAGDPPLSKLSNVEPCPWLAL